MDTECIEIFKGKYFDKHHNSRSKKVIAFDLDETLGEFGDLKTLWDLIQKNKYNIDFQQLVDLYPEFIRYGIFAILEYLLVKKKSGECFRVYIYTNNQSNTNWVHMLVDYFNNKINRQEKVIDHAICAFKINNKRIELARTSHKKSHTDFINCTLLPKSTLICFLDNTNFEEMQKDRIYYIKPESYRHTLTTQLIVRRIMGSHLSQYITNKPLFTSEFNRLSVSKGLYKTMNDVSNISLRRNIQISQRIMYHIRDFFILTYRRKYTRKMKNIPYRHTRKRS